MHKVHVPVDNISADEPSHAAFSHETTSASLKQWARERFISNPPSDKAYYLNDDKSRHRFTTEEELQTLGQLGYDHVAHFRLNEEQAAGCTNFWAVDAV
jgi:hypothetical protein